MTLNTSPSPATSRAIYTEADHDVFLKWEAWRLGLGAALHEYVIEDITNDAPRDDLRTFFDVYGLALEQAHGLSAAIDFAVIEPRRSDWHLTDPQTCEFKNRLEAALNGDKVAYPKDRLPAVAQQLRLQAASLLSLADCIEQGAFEFPQDTTRPSTEI